MGFKEVPGGLAGKPRLLLLLLVFVVVVAVVVAITWVVLSKGWIEAGGV